MGTSGMALRVIALSALSLACACGSVKAAADAGGDDDTGPNIDDDAGPDIDAGHDAPALSSIEPTSGIVTTQVTLTGTDFGTTSASVSIGGADATIVSWSDTSIVVSVPETLFPGDRDITVTTPAGTSGAQTFRVILPPTVYIANEANDATLMAGNVEAFSFDPDTGALSGVGGLVSIGQDGVSYGGCSGAATVHEGTRRLFATGNTGVSVFDIDSVSGELTLVEGSPFAIGSTNSANVRVNADGTRLFVAAFSGGPGTIGVFDIDTDGVLTAVAGSPFADGHLVDHLVITHNEKFLYVNSEDNTFEGYSIAAAGSLSALAGSPFTHGFFSFGMALRPGMEQFVIPDGTPRLNMFNVNPSTGVNTAVAGSPFAVTVPAGSLHYPVYTPDGNRLYVGSNSAGHLLGFSLAASGTPTPLPGSPYDFTATMNSFACLSMSRDGAYLLATNETGKIAVFSLAGDGTPTHVIGSPFTQAATTPDASGMAITF